MSWTDNAPQFVISVAAQRAEMHPQTLRQYDRLGLVVPGRAAGRGRRYSERDIAVLREVQRLSVEEGVNLAGIRQILALQAQVRGLRAEVEFLRAQRDSRQRVFAVHPEQGAEAVAPTRRSAGLAGQSQASDLAEPKAASQRQDAGQTAPRQSTALIIWHD